MRPNPSLETRITITWIAYSAIFSAVIGSKANFVSQYSFGLACFSVIAASIILSLTLRHLVLGVGSGDNLLLFAIAACLYCANFTVKLNLPVITALMVSFAVLIGAFAWSKSSFIRAKRSVAEIYITLLIVLSCGALSVLLTIVFEYFDPIKADINHCAPIAQLSHSAHIFPLTIAGYGGLFLGISGFYRNLVNGDFYKTQGLARILVLILLGCVGLVVAYFYPRGWAALYGTEFNRGLLMIALTFGYFSNLFLLPYIVFSRFKSKFGLKFPNLKVFILTVLIGGIIQGTGTALLRHQVTKDKALTQLLALHLTVELLIAGCFAFGIVLVAIRAKRMIRFTEQKYDPTT